MAWEADFHDEFLTEYDLLFEQESWVTSTAFERK